MRRRDAPSCSACERLSPSSQTSRHCNVCPRSLSMSEIAIEVLVNNAGLDAATYLVGGTIGLILAFVTQVCFLMSVTVLGASVPSVSTTVVKNPRESIVETVLRDHFRTRVRVSQARVNRRCAAESCAVQSPRDRCGVRLQLDR